MQYLDDYRDSARIRTLTDAIDRATTRAWNIMEICGGQTHTIARYRIEEILPSAIRLLHGPGCPVCVTPVSTIDHAIAIARRPNVIFASFGDMMRVPGSQTDLLRVKAQGADVRLLYSPLDAVELAALHPNREVVFFAVGFETTAPVHLMALSEARRRALTNFSLLTSLFAVPPAIAMILDQPDNRIDGFLAAGHVCAVTGNAPCQRLSAKYHRPIIITGFEPVDILYGIYKCICQLEHHESRVENAYKRAVPEAGNPAAQQLMNDFLEPATREWRGLGAIPSSGFRLREAFAEFDAAQKFPLRETAPHAAIDTRCIAGEIMKGNRQVVDCPCFDTICTPTHPLGASMVSAEGVCAARHNYNQQ
ncbi:MAG: hydrogenase formation protein HypD [Bacteroidales bacterium]|jgi:hydrogenase expression/formation protein HypD|nr:hydrogenase formation protein HypD [Bacteroidales bacterium]